MDDEWGQGYAQGLADARSDRNEELRDAEQEIERLKAENEELLQEIRELGDRLAGLA